MARFFLLEVAVFALGIDTIARKPGHDKATCRFKANTGLEPRLRDRHCVTCRPLRKPTGDILR
jgi:hypothetical protein